MGYDNNNSQHFTQLQGRLFFKLSHIAKALMKSVQSFKINLVDNKNSASEVPEGNSISIASAMCNAGLYL